MELSGDGDLLARLRAQRKRVPEEVRTSTFQQAQQVLQAAQALTPVKTGDLRDSGKVVAEGDAYQVVFTDPKAAAVHERLDVSHEQGQAKFLEQPFNASLPGLHQAWQGAVNRGLQ